MVKVTLYIAYFAFKEGADIDIVGDFLAGDGDRGGVAVTELLPYLGEREIRFLAEEIHRQAAG